MKKYILPDFLVNLITQERYERWLRRKADAHFRRDKTRGNRIATAEQYRLSIHEAVLLSRGYDAYTHEQLDWSLLCTYDNDQSKTHGREYKKQFALLPSIDHVDAGTGSPNFKICSWRTNDAKSDLPYDEFVDLCKLVVAAAGNKNQI
jgi:hypothetical protein